MIVTLRPDIERKIHDRLKAGQYKSADELVNAVLERYMADDFGPGELDKLLSIGEEQARQGRFVDGDEVFRRLDEAQQNPAEGRMSRYILTEQAEADLQDIWDYIATDSIDVADAVGREFRSAFEKLATMPGIGHRRLDVTNGRYRFWRIYRFIIAYFPDTMPLQIVRVVGGQRDFRKLFGQP